MTAKKKTTDQPYEDLLKELQAARQVNEQLLNTLKVLDQVLWVQQGQKMKLLRVPDIAFITTNPRGLDVYTVAGEKFINFDAISNMEAAFAVDPRMMRTHKSYLVNLNQIDTVEISSSGRVLTFKGLPPELTAKVTYEYLAEFEKRLGKGSSASDSPRKSSTRKTTK